jgi:putative tricarboxylic transport membrane protein
MHTVDRFLRTIRPYSEVIVLSVLLVAVVWLRLFLPELITVRRIQGWIVLGPDAWPRTLINLALVCLGGLIALALFDLRRKLTEGMEEDGASAADLGRWFVIIGLIAAYITLLPYGGFILSTLAFGVSYCAVVGLRKPIEMLGLPAGFLLVSFLLFTQLLSVPLPRGVGVLRQLSYFVY